MNFGRFRADFFNAGIDPRAVETMSLYEILSMIQGMAERNKGNKPRQVTDEEWAEAEAMLAAVTINDPNVRLH